MDPFRNLRLRFEQGVVRAYESLTEGWRELLSRSSGALTHFDAAGKSKEEERTEVSYQDGVITVIVPKTETIPPRQLTIS